MIKIYGKLKRIYKKKCTAPNDGTHSYTKRGYIKGTRGAYINGHFVPHGLYGFYWRLTKTTGVKVYYSIKWRRPRKGYKTVKKHFDRMMKYYKRGLATKPLGIVRVKLNFGHKQYAWGLLQRHVHYPKYPWMRMAKGHPYNFGYLDPRIYTNHSVAGFKAFRKQVGTKLKIGDVVYCKKRKRWYIVDIAAV